MTTRSPHPDDPSPGPPERRPGSAEIEVLAGALDVPESEREAFLAERCGGDDDLRARVEALLALEERAGDFLEAPAVLGDAPSVPAGGSTTADDPAAPDAGESSAGASGARRGQRIGAYRLLEPLGEGGMGVVWLAEEEGAIRRRVALKLIRYGHETGEVLHRFEAERSALARMDHPSIARVYAAGATEDGRPYFAMEVVRGAPITEWCDARRLSIAERLALLRRVALGVEHAHRSGVVHRDLKPSNILVAEVDGEPVPKIIDFGVAKATDRRAAERTLYTGLGRAVGTPAYMSPEQADPARGEVDARTDVWALGVVLYELLVGERPLDWSGASRLSLDEIVRRIREEDPPVPSVRWSRLSARARSEAAERRSASPTAVAAALRSDLDWIAMRALEKEPGRRYATAAELAEDVERHRRHEPVRTGPPSALYRLLKFARKNRGPVRAAAAVTLALCLGLALTAWFAAESRERLEQVLRLSDVKKLADYQDELDTLWPAVPERIPALRAWLEKAEALGGRLEEHRRTLARLRARATGSGKDGPGTFPDAGARWQHDTLADLVERLERFTAPERWGPTIASVRARLQTARELAALERSRRWRRLAGRDPSYFRPGAPEVEERLGEAVGPAHPVESVSWKRAREVLARAGLALPSEAQWEHAARAGTDTPWWCGERAACLVDRENLADRSLDSRTHGQLRCESWDDGHAGYARAGSYPPNAFGLHDVAGNVAEWCRDAYRPGPADGAAEEGGPPGDAADAAGTDGGTDSATDTLRVYRGGSWQRLARFLRSADRKVRAPSDHSLTLGVRPARALRP